MDPSRINLRGMLRLDPVEDLLSTVLQRLNNIEATVSEQKKLIEGAMGRQAAQDSLSELHRMVKSIQAKVDIIESSSTILIGSQNLSVRDLSYKNFIELKEIKNNLPGYIQRNELEMKLNDINNYVTQEFKSLKESTATYELVTNLQDGQKLATER